MTDLGRTRTAIDPNGPLVVTDLDGSFWGHELRCHPDTLSAVAELEQRGVPLLVATGRRAGSARVGLVENGLLPPAVLLNGAIGVDLESDEMFHRRPFDPAAVSVVLDRLATIGCSPVLYLIDGSTTGALEATTGEEHRRSMGADYVIADPGEVAASGVVLAMTMIGMPRNQVESVPDVVPAEVADVLLYSDHLYSALSGVERWSVHIQPVGITKRDGIKAYVAHAGLRPSRIIAVGDGTNDLEMLDHADVALGVAGGHAEALAVADEVIDAPDDGGWCRVLDFVDPV